jgi:hypothetical protein
MRTVLADVRRALGRRRRLAIVAGCLAVATGATDAAAYPITMEEALQRADVVTVKSDQTTAWRVCATKDQTYDLRGLTATGVFGNNANLSIGNDCAEVGVVAVGGSAIGTLSHSLTWAQVKSQADGDGLRFEGNGWLASFDVRVVDLEDGFAPRVGVDADHNTAWFLLDGAYMNWIRDDAIEDDELMSGSITDVLIDGTNRFLSARPSEHSSISNPGMLVRVRDALVHMRSMPNGRAQDGHGFGGIFKWSSDAGKVDVANSIFFLDERPIESEPLAPGTYRHVTLVLAFDGHYPGHLPRGVTVTRDRSVWRQARAAWLASHAV